MTILVVALAALALWVVQRRVAPWSEPDEISIGWDGDEVRCFGERRPSVEEVRALLYPDPDDCASQDERSACYARVFARALDDAERTGVYRLPFDDSYSATMRW